MIFRTFERADRPQVLSLLARSLAEWRGAGAEAYWEWKFESNPHGKARVWVAAEEGRIAGCYIWNPVRLLQQGTPALGAQSVDAAVDPDFRRRGIFTGLVEAAVNDSRSSELAAVYAFPVEGALQGQVRFGFEPRWTVAAIHRPLLVRPRASGTKKLVADEVDSFDERFDAFATARGYPGFTVARDGAYLQWRYADHPARTYETLACSSNGELAGYCVFSVDSGRRLTRGIVLDLQVLPQAEEAASFLVSQALRRMAARGVKIAVSWVRQGGPEHAALAEAGFSPRYQSIKRRLERSAYAPQLIVYESRAAGTGGGQEWSLVPGDHDST